MHFKLLSHWGGWRGLILHTYNANIPRSIIIKEELHSKEYMMLRYTYVCFTVKVDFHVVYLYKYGRSN